LEAKDEGYTELSMPISVYQKIFTMPGPDEKFLFKENITIEAVIFWHYLTYVEHRNLGVF